MQTPPMPRRAPRVDGDSEVSCDDGPDELAFGARGDGTADAGDLTGGEDERIGCAQIVVDVDHERSVDVDAGAQAQTDGEFELRSESPAEGDEVGRHGARGARAHASGRVDARQFDLGDAAGAAHGGDDGAGAQRHPVAQERGRVADALPQLAGFLQGAQRRRGPARERVGVDHLDDLDSGLGESCGDGEEEGPRARDHGAASGAHLVRLQHRLHTTGGHDPRQRPAGDRKLAVVGSGRDHESPRPGRPLGERQGVGAADRAGAQCDTVVEAVGAPHLSARDVPDASRGHRCSEATRRSV